MAAGPSILKWYSMKTQIVSTSSMARLLTVEQPTKAACRRVPLARPLNSPAWQATLTTGLKVTYCPNNCPAPVPTSAVSRKVHGAAGTFDINLPLVPISGAVGIEYRQQGAGTPGDLLAQCHHDW